MTCIFKSILKHGANPAANNWMKKCKVNRTCKYYLVPLPLQFRMLWQPPCVQSAFEHHPVRSDPDPRPAAIVVPLDVMSFSTHGVNPKPLQDFQKGNILPTWTLGSTTNFESTSMMTETNKETNYCNQPTNQPANQPTNKPTRTTAPAVFLYFLSTLAKKARSNRRSGRQGKVSEGGWNKWPSYLQMALD